MAWRIGKPESYYTANVRFPRRDLLQITAEEVAGWLSSIQSLRKK
jgi:hypothetical protein